jgi:3-phosphoshikimate 1-carboxyvinyltransferase
MQWKVAKSSLQGKIIVPPSKSHTIRAFVIATLAQGTSTIRSPLCDGDGASAVAAARGLGANVEIDGGIARITAARTTGQPGTEWIDVGNSGTSTNLFAGAAATTAAGHWFTGDDSLKSRPAKPLLNALFDLGAKYSFQSEHSDIPFFIAGPIRGGHTTVNGISSQFVSSLLLCCPLARDESHIEVVDLHEVPYVRMTLWWLDKMGIQYTASQDLSDFVIPGKQHYSAIDETIGGDFSSAAFPAVAAALAGAPITIENIDFSDPQGDKDLFSLLESLGASVKRDGRSATVSAAQPVRGGVVDLNAMPDALPALSVLATKARDTVSIVNVKQARIKETDRIAVMTQELSKMGALIEEQRDGLKINPSELKGAHVNGHGDHRVVMALALAGMIAEGETIIDTAESAAVTYPSFAQDFRALGANIEIIAN